MRAMLAGVLVLVAAGICLGQTATTHPAQDAGAMQQKSEAEQNSETKQLFVPAAPKTDFEARLEQMLKLGKLKPGKHFAFKDAHPDAFQPMIFPNYCFTMRTYTFSRQADGSAPSLKGISTCTRASNYQLREAKPDVKVVPAE